jgi:hypothetical protein
MIATAPAQTRLAEAPDQMRSVNFIAETLASGIAIRKPSSPRCCAKWRSSGAALDKRGRWL